MIGALCLRADSFQNSVTNHIAVLCSNVTKASQDGFEVLYVSKVENTSATFWERIRLSESKYIISRTVLRMEPFLEYTEQGTHQKWQSTHKIRFLVISFELRLYRLLKLPDIDWRNTALA